MKRKRDKAREYTSTTLKRLHALSGNECAHPDCTNQVIANDDTVIGEICHIEAANQNGLRYNPNMTDNDRRHYDNLILLCADHHSIIDNKPNESRYPVELLREWKTNHASKQQMKRVRNPFLLKRAVDAIASTDFGFANELGLDKVESFDINDKIEHNAIKRNAPLLEDYKVYHAKINAIYDELEAQGSFKKERLLRNIRHIYLKVKGKYVNGSSNVMERIREHADDIFEDVEAMLLEKVEKSSEILDDDFSFEVSIIMVDAFMRCKILESPTES